MKRPHTKGDSEYVLVRRIPFISAQADPAPNMKQRPRWPSNNRLTYVLCQIQTAISDDGKSEFLATGRSIEGSTDAV